MAQNTQAKRASRGKAAQPKPKVRGTALTILLVIIGLHGILGGYLYYALRMDTASISKPWILGLMSIHFLMNVVAAVGIWFWKKWGLYVYAASTVLALVVGLISMGIWSVFYMILPLAILGWVLRTKWSYFT
jgi:hypothetical protein